MDNVTKYSVLFVKVSLIIIKAPQLYNTHLPDSLHSHDMLETQDEQFLEFNDGSTMASISKYRFSLGIYGNLPSTSSLSSSIKLDIFGGRLCITINALSDRI